MKYKIIPAEEYDVLHARLPRLFEECVECCDCGLVHDITYVVKNNGKKLLITATRNERSTSQIRRWKKHARNPKLSEED